MRKGNPVLSVGECRYIAPSDDVFGEIRTIDNGVDALGNPAKNACAVTLINRSARNFDVYLTSEELGGAKELRADNGVELGARGGAFTIHLEGMRGRTFFAVCSGSTAMDF